MVVRGYTGIFLKTYSLKEGTWSPWFTLDGLTPDAPGACVLNGLLYVSVRGFNYDQIWVTSVDLATMNHDVWTLIDGNTPSVPSLSL
jgi:hypothetical protein